MNNEQRILDQRLGEIETELLGNPALVDSNRADLCKSQQAMTCGLGRQLRSVRLARKMLRAGVYGICQSCGKQIAEARLEAAPWAFCCVACADALETGADRKNRVDEMEAALDRLISQRESR